jgi:hypothetical protein
MSLLSTASHCPESSMPSVSTTDPAGRRLLRRSMTLRSAAVTTPRCRTDALYTVASWGASTAQATRAAAPRNSAPERARPPARARFNREPSQTSPRAISSGTTQYCTAGSRSWTDHG